MTDHLLTLYVCPQCKGSLQPAPQVLKCSTCGRVYPFARDIPDFLLIRPQDSANPVLHDVSAFEKLARIYETVLWYPLMLKLLGGRHAYSFKELLAYAQGMMSPVRGLVLDVATGTGTFGRRLAGHDRTVYGIDISLDMLGKGQDYTRREGITGMNFARADVEALPFADGLFDGCFLCGSLHTFPDPHRALIEIGRTLKCGAPVLVTTLTWGKSGILKYAWMRRRMCRQNKLRIFDRLDLDHTLPVAALEPGEPEDQGARAALRKS